MVPMHATYPNEASNEPPFQGAGLAAGGASDFFWRGSAAGADDKLGVVASGFDLLAAEQFGHAVHGGESEAEFGLADGGQGDAEILAGD